jgi:hypothetical protein
MNSKAGDRLPPALTRKSDFFLCLTQFNSNCPITVTAAGREVYSFRSPVSLASLSV